MPHDSDFEVPCSLKPTRKTLFFPTPRRIAWVIVFYYSHSNRSGCRHNRLVIKERDDVLAENVIKTCKDYPGRPVVAVLGLLHCNGVAEILRNSAGFRTVAMVGAEE